MIEIAPLVFLDGRPQKEGEDYKFNKLSDKSVEFYFKKEDASVIITPSKLINGKPSVRINGRQIDFNDYQIESFQDQKKPGVVIWFRGLPIKKLGLIPRVLTEDEETKYKARQVKEARRKYEREHGFLWK